MFKSLRVVLVVLVIGILMVSGQSQAQDVGVSEDTIKLGSFIAQSGGVAFIGVPFFRGADAWYNWVNAHGGINGRMIEFIACDDGFNPANSVACVQQLLEEDEVFAIVNPLGTPTLAAVIDDLAAQEIPVVSPGANATFLSEPLKPTVFALQPNNAAFGRFAARYPVITQGHERIAAVYADDAFGNELREAFEEALDELGIEPVALVAHDPNETNFSNAVLQLQAANPDAVAMFNNLAPAAAILTEAENLGFSTQFIGMNTVTDPQLFDLTTTTAVEGLIAPGFAFDPTLDIPGAQLYRAVLNDPETGYPDEPAGGFSEIAYVGAQVVTQALAVASLTGELTRESFVDALNSLSDFSTGLTPPFSYSEDDHSGIQQLFVIQVIDGQFVSLGTSE